jgi:hypothetical protein
MANCKFLKCRTIFRYFYRENNNCMNDRIILIYKCMVAKIHTISIQLKPLTLIIIITPTPAPDESAGNTLTPPFSPKPGETDPSYHIIPLHKSPGLEVMWNCFFQLSLQESNGGLAAKDYLVVPAVSPFYPKDRSGRLAWFVMWPGPTGRIISSSETRLKTGAALRLEDSAISSHLPTEEYPINYVRMKKPLWHEPGHVIYEITSDLFSRFRYP